jgi:glutathione synthase/RimK-type ligase-like ATP-grasp enzyme
MSVLIASLPGDAHGLSVKWALEQKDALVDLICWSDYPQKHASSFSIANGLPCQMSLAREGRALDLDAVTSLWSHRTLKATPPSSIHRADHPPILDSAEHYFRGMTARLEGQAFAVNPSAAKWRYDNKLNQLSVAQACGLRFPATLISNDFDDVQAFIAAHGGCITKPLKFMIWDCGAYDVSLFTTVLKSLEGVNRLSIEACPMIYQERIEKRCEYRIVVFGREVVCVELDSQADPNGAEDWRAIDYHALPARVVAPPPGLVDRLFDFMQRCGFVCGSFDFALSPDGELVFFEFNETGQFLWLEELCPDAPFLDIFAEFLLSARPDFRYRQIGAPCRFESWLKDFPSHAAEARTIHVPTNLDKRFPEAPRATDLVL